MFEYHLYAQRNLSHLTPDEIREVQLRPFPILSWYIAALVGSLLILTW